jgi:uncharacterized RDD family membrane protein YckC
MNTSTSITTDTSGVQPDEQVVTGEAVAVELRLAGVGSRGIAALIDIAITTGAELAAVLIIVLIGPGSNAATFGAVLIASIVAIVLGYPVALETLWRGRTLGKAIMGLRVVRDDGGPIRFRHALVRGLLGVVVEKPGVLYGLPALISMLCTDRNKRLGDLLAGTVVLQDRVPGQLETPIMMPPALAGWASPLDLSAIDDSLALRMRHYLARSGQFTPDARATLEHQITAEVVSRVGPAPANTPGWAVIAAVLAERRNRAFATTQQYGQQWQASTQPPGEPAVGPATDGGFVRPS